MKLLFALALLASPAFAELPRVTAATASPDATGWRFDVTLTHPDTGWDHYADAWEVVAPDGTVLGTRDLAHPHVEEQPFTRSLAGVVIADGIDHVLIRARCSVDGWGPTEFRVDLPR
jgi:hypothetical protein